MIFMKHVYGSRPVRVRIENELTEIAKEFDDVDYAIQYLKKTGYLQTSWGAYLTIAKTREERERELYFGEDYDEDFGDDLSGRVLDEMKAKTSPCKNVTGTKLYFVPGVVGALSEAQVEEYCKGKKVIPVEAPVLRARIEALKRIMTRRGRGLLEIARRLEEEARERKR